MTKQAENQTSEPVAPHSAVICTEDLASRTCRAPDYKLENELLLKLSEEMANSPETILQKLAEAILRALNIDSAGVSLLSDDGKSFVWPAVTGALSPYLGEGTPRDFGPCGDVLDNNCHLLFKDPARRYQYINQIKPAVQELLLVPFYAQDNPVGTIWAVSHSPDRSFDLEDLRMLTSLSKFAASAYWTTRSLKTLQQSEIEARSMADQLLYLHHTLQSELKNQLKHTSAELSRSDDELRSIALLVSQQIQEPAKVMSSYLKLLAVRYKGRLGKDADEFIEKCLYSSATIMRMLDDLWYHTRANRQVDLFYIAEIKAKVTCLTAPNLSCRAPFLPVHSYYV